MFSIKSRRIRNGELGQALPAAPASLADPLKEVRALKRYVQIGVYTAILGTEPFYFFVLHYSWPQLLSGLVVGMTIAFTAIEWAFSQIFKLRKRSAYPNQLLQELSQAPTMVAAAQRALPVANGLLRVRASFAAILREGESGLQLLCASGMDQAKTTRLLETEGAEIARGLVASGSHAWVLTPRSQGSRCLRPGESLTIVPISSMTRTIGVLALVGREGAGDLKDHELLRVVGMALGLSMESLRDKEELAQTASLLSTTLDSTADGILVVSADGRIESFNAKFAEMWGIPRSVLESRDDGLALAFVLDQLENADEFIAQVKELYARPDAESRDTLRFKDGRAFERFSQPRRLGGRIVGRVWSFRDITERVKAEETIRHLAYHDVLTGLPNRAQFEERLRIDLAQARRSRQKVAVMFLDLDRFKAVNDTVGHNGGDELLREVAGEFAATIREGDTVARVGGDEFTFILPGIEQPDDAAVVAERILRSIRRPRIIAGQEFHVTTSIGISVFPKDGSDADALMRNADTAMYRAKERGRDNHQLFMPAMKASLMETLAMENQLAHALERDELFLVYQPIVDLMSGRIVGGEALLRWRHPTRGLVEPDEFIPLAEGTGLIVSIGEWVLRTACAQAKAWQDDGFGPLRVTVNVSARQVEQPGLIPAVAGALRQTGLGSQYLHVELTEGAVMRQVDPVVSTLSELRAMGVGISVDDFGTGYSSLGYLKRFPIDTIKIDRSFVQDVTTDQNDAAIVTTVVTMARSLNLRVVAEGVETEEQLGFLRDIECDEFQGFLTSPPVSAEEFAALVKHHQGRQASVLSLKSG
jgi:diguanylate cyclase (GGDEF)-like protein/PAS domain S-box-containing protein